MTEFRDEVEAWPIRPSHVVIWAWILLAVGQVGYAVWLFGTDNWRAFDKLIIGIFALGIAGLNLQLRAARIHSRAATLALAGAEKYIKVKKREGRK